MARQLEVKCIEKVFGTLPKPPGAAFTDDHFRSLVGAFRLGWVRREKQTNPDMVQCLAQPGRLARATRNASHN
jgi:hypothetical protein